MSFSERFLAGFALAATIAKDPSARMARDGLADSIADTLTQTARELSELDRLARRAQIRALTEPTPYDPPSEPSRPARAHALLARMKRADEIPSWLRDAPLPRAGYVVERRLMSLLSRIAARTTIAPHKKVESWGE
jgi:hypothetical protein